MHILFPHCVLKPDFTTVSKCIVRALATGIAFYFSMFSVSNRNCAKCMNGTIGRKVKGPETEF